MTILLRLCINAAALWTAVRVVPGVSFTGDWRLLLVVALIFGALNAALKPLLILLTLPFLVLTLGLFTLVVNAFLLWMTSALSGARESTAFAIDNVPPVITVTSVRRDNGRATITFDVRDTNSSVQKVDFSLDGDKWQSVYPKDGIADSRFEQFELVLEGDAVSRGVTLRATDALNNTASARGEIPEPAASGRR